MDIGQREYTRNVRETTVDGGFASNVIFIELSSLTCRWSVLGAHV